MNADALASLLPAWQSRPPALRYPCAAESDLQQFEAVHGPIPAEFRAFLQIFGGGVVGSEWVDGITQLNQTHTKFKAESGAKGWSLSNTFVIGWEGAGNPFGIHAQSGAVVVEDHTFGGIHELAPSFEDFLRKGLSYNGF